jgi:CheY-like chemotaxis protein
MNVIQDDNSPQEGARKDDHADPPRGRPDRRQVILLVEDTEADRDVYGGLLWYNGYDVIHVADGQTAIDRALELQPDLILLDIMLPGEVDGLEVARTLRDRGMRTPIVALSAHSRDAFGSRVEGAEVDAYLEKPVDPFKVVKETIRRIGLARPSGPET